MSTEITVKAEGKVNPDRAMTLDELRAFVAECDRLEVPGSTLLDVRTRGLSAKLRSIETA